jgi:hypothetical protein
MSFKLGYLSMENICEYGDHNALVTSENVSLKCRICRGKHWSSKWRDNEPKVDGTIIGYVSDNGLVGENVGREYNQVQQGQKDWCVVKWDNGKCSVYPIGAKGIFALAFCDEVQVVQEPINHKRKRSSETYSTPSRSSSTSKPPLTPGQIDREGVE